MNFFLQVHLRCQQSDIVPIISHRYQQHQPYQWQIVPQMSLIPVVHLHLRIFLRIFKKIEMTLMLFSGAWGG
jgi:hypothetical protein